MLGFALFSDPVTVNGAAVPIFEQRATTATAPQATQVSAEPAALAVNLPHAGKLLIQFTGIAYEIDAPDPEAASFQFTLQVDGQPIRPTVPEILLVPAITGTPLHVTAMPTLSAGSHTIEVVALSTGGAVYTVWNQALTATGPLN